MKRFMLVSCVLALATLQPRWPGCAHCGIGYADQAAADAHTGTQLDDCVCRITACD